MDIIGKWKVKQLNIPTLDGVIQCTPDNMPEGEIFEEFAPMANAIFEFTPEGSLDMLLSFSAEELEDAASTAKGFATDTLLRNPNRGRKSMGNSTILRILRAK